MISFKLGGVRLRVNLATILLMPLARMLAPGRMGYVLAALGLHEAAHVLMAKIRGVRIEELTFMPFGAVARFQNLYGIANGDLVRIAAAGPLANLLAAPVCGALAWWGVLPAYDAAMLIRAGCMLAAFNLIPALPLDGGRILYALLSRRISPGRALMTGVWLGRGLAALMTGVSLIGFALCGRVNITVMMSAVLIIFSGGIEGEGLRRAEATAVLQRMAPIIRPTPVRMYAVDADSDAAALLKKCRPGIMTVFAAFDREGRMRLVDERSIQMGLIGGDN